jgi:DNA polymerase I-like protein with 3'-5' exonuclease and polymerase domains
VSELVKEKMSKAVKLNVPLDVDAGIGENWTEAKG